MHHNYHSQPLCVVTDVSRFRSFDDPHIRHYISHHVPTTNLVSSACYRSINRTSPNHVSQHVPNANMVSSASTRSMNNTRYHGEHSGHHICPYKHRSSSSIKRCTFKQKKNAALCNGHSGNWNDFDMSSKPYYHLRT